MLEYKYQGSHIHSRAVSARNVAGLAVKPLLSVRVTARPLISPAMGASKLAYAYPAPMST
jgi:hypothetical protein